MPARITHEHWLTAGRRRYGPDPDDWRFVCPRCGHVASGRDFAQAGGDPGAAAQSCLGTVTGGWSAEGPEAQGPCNYTAGRLLERAPVTVVLQNGTVTHVFEFDGVAFVDDQEEHENGTPEGVVSDERPDKRTTAGKRRRGRGTRSTD